MQPRLCVGIDLSSRAVSSRVLSALQSLTSVFGMGTGGPSALKTPTDSGICTLKTEQRGRMSKANACKSNCRSSSRVISTDQLNMLPCLHLRPINVIVYDDPYSKEGRSYLRESFTLRCLQRLSRPDIATQLCPWQDNWCTRGQSIPVLSY